ncbi:MAG: glycosyl hydrolase [Bacteroidota bacterium]|nr:glycosyl hydrolase [Bacteroidota bacterium]
MILRTLAVLGILMAIHGCMPAPDAADTPGLSDPKASPMATAFFSNLQLLSADHVLVGHQDALAYGMGWKGEAFRTDINDVLGDHPAVFGWDLGHMGDEQNIDGVPFEDMRDWAIAVYEKGGVNTFSWHMRNYATGGTSWDTDSCVEACLPGGSSHELYLERLDQAAEFFSSLRTESGELIPVIFRPFHEMTGSWFWWGRGNCSARQYRALFQFTIDYFRNIKGLHQLIIAYSSDRFNTTEQYMDFYPGDDYVDVMAFDDYHGLASKERTPGTIHMLEVLDSLSIQHQKLMAISETGLETIPNEKWFTDVVLHTLDANESTRNAVWILFWRNGRPDHFYAPHTGHPSVPDFIEFMNHDLMLSLSELPELYK